MWCDWHQHVWLLGKGSSWVANTCVTSVGIGSQDYPAAFSFSDTPVDDALMAASSPKQPPHASHRYDVVPPSSQPPLATPPQTDGNMNTEPTITTNDGILAVQPPPTPNLPLTTLQLHSIPTSGGWSLHSRFGQTTIGNRWSLGSDGSYCWDQHDRIIV